VKFKELRIGFTHREGSEPVKPKSIGSIITGVASKISNPGIWRAFLTDDGTATGNPLLTGDNRLGYNTEVICTAVFPTDSPRNVPISNCIDITGDSAITFKCLESQTSSIGIFGGTAMGLEPSENPAIKVHFIVIVYGSNIS
jgi:hypothetical protein